MDVSQLIGSWRLRSFELRAASGERSYPFGRNASGFLLYSSDGYMSAVLMAEERPRFRSSDIRAATQEEQAQAAATYLSYCGRYEVRDDRVIHHVEVSLFPNWIGQPQERIVELNGGRLSLSTPPIQVQGVDQRAYLIWERPISS